MKYEQIITQFQQQAPARIAQLGRLAAVSIESRPEAERQLKIIKTVLRALAVEGSLRSKVLIISAARDRAGVGLDYPTLAQVNCTSCQPIGNVSGIGLPVSDLDVQTQVPGIGTDTLRATLTDLYARLSLVNFTPVNTANGRNFDVPTTSGQVHNYPTLDDFVRAVVFRYSPVGATLAHEHTTTLFKVGDIIPSLTLTLTHTQGGNAIAVKRIFDTSGTNNIELVEQLEGSITNPTNITLTNVSLGAQRDLRSSGKLSREWTAFVQDKLIEGQGGTIAQPKTYLDFVYPSFYFQTNEEITTLPALSAGTLIKSGEELVIARGTHTTQGKSFNNEYMGYAFPASYGNLGFVGQEADGFTTNLLNLSAFRGGQHFDATVTYTGADGVNYSVPYKFILSREKLTAPNNFRFTHN